LIFKKIISFYIPAAALLLLPVSCERNNKPAGNNEGIIEFKTTAINKTDPLFELAPTKATLKFKDGKFIIEMSVMSVFNTSVISDAKSRTMTQTVKFMNIKQYCVENEKDLEPENEEYRLTLRETDETKEIAGLKCHKVKATKVNNPAVSFDVWYTKELECLNCNVLTPYAGLNGVMMDYRIKKMGLEMHFVAQSFKSEEVAENTFEIPPHLKKVSKEEMAKIFTDL
jgi:hypothetical protein